MASATCRLMLNGPEVAEGARPRCWYRITRKASVSSAASQRRGVIRQAGTAVQDQHRRPVSGQPPGDAALRYLGPEPPGIGQPRSTVSVWAVSSLPR